MISPLTPSPMGEGWVYTQGEGFVNNSTVRKPKNFYIDRFLIFTKPLRFARPLRKGTNIAVLDLSEIIPSVRFQVLFKSIKFF